MNIFNDRDYTEDEFNNIYKTIKILLTEYKTPATENPNCSILLGGQPGSGKSSYYSNFSTSNQIIIDTDDFRKFHPNLDSICSLDAENYVNRTQEFASRIVERLIKELSFEKYNLIIEGTLRTSEIPIKTCQKLINEGHNVKLIVIACDACKSWESTIERAEKLIEMHYKPRLVPIDKYDLIVQNIVSNLKTIENTKLFTSIDVIDRNGNILNLNISPHIALEHNLNIDNWNKNKAKYEKEFIEFKIKMLQNELKLR